MKINKEQQRAIKKIAKKHGLKLVLLFGSFASGKTHKNSDLDIAVLGNKNISFKNQICLINEFMDIFKKDVDLSFLNTANPLLLFQVSKNPILLFGDKTDFINFRLNAFHRYNDYKPYFKMEKELNKRTIKQYAA